MRGVVVVVHALKVTSARIARTFGTFSRWARLAVSRHWGSDHELTAARLDRVWRYAQRGVAARFAVLCLRERCVPGQVVGHTLQLSVSQSVLTLSIKAVGHFGLVVPDLDGKRSAAFEDPSLLINDLREELGLNRKATARLREELADGAFNLALALLAAEMRDRLAVTSPDDPRVRDTEHFVTYGHPWDPFCRTRIGADLRGNLVYGPEQLAHSPLRAVDIRAELVTRTPTFDRVAFTLFGRPPQGWVRIPVHAHQARRMAELVGARWGHDFCFSQAAAHPGRSLTRVGTVTVQPNLSPRIDLELAPGIKEQRHDGLPIVQRPAVSTLLARINKRDDHTRKGLALLLEKEAAAVDPEAVAGDAGQLDVVARLSTATMTPEGGRSMVCAALGEKWPGRYETLLSRALCGYPARGPQQGEFFWRDYVSKLLPPLLRFACMHGVGLHANVADTILVVKDGRVLGFLLRDVGNVVIHPGRLAAAGHDLTIPADASILTDDMAQVHEHVLDGLLSDHIPAVLQWLAQDCGLSPEVGWGWVRQIIQESLARWESIGEREVDWDADRRVYLGSVVRLRAVLRPRLDPGRDPAPIRFRNPIADAAPVDRAA